MKLLIQFYADATPQENPLQLPADYPWRCKEVADEDAAGTEVPQGWQLVNFADYDAGKDARFAVYTQNLAAYEAAQATIILAGDA